MMMSCLPAGFILSCNANCVTELYHAWRSGERFFISICCKKDQNNRPTQQYIFQKEHRSELLKHFRRQVRHIEKRIVF